MPQRRKEETEENSQADDSRRSRLYRGSLPGMLPGEGVHVVAPRSWMSPWRHLRDYEKASNVLGTVLGEGGLLLLEDSAGNSTAFRMDSRTGDVLWRRALSEDAESRFVGASAVRCGGCDGGETVIVGGHTIVRYGGRHDPKRSLVQPAALKLDARSGEELWRFGRDLGGVIEDDGGGSTPIGEVLGVATDPSGDVFIVGYLAEGLFRENPAVEATSFVSKLDGSTGRVLWTRENQGAWYNYLLLSAASDGEGNVIAAGYSNFASRFGDERDRDYLVVKFDPRGRPLWEHRVGDASDEGYFSVAVDRANDVYLGGREEVLGSRAAGVFRPVVHKRAGRDGRNLWTYGGTPGSNSPFLGVEFDEASGVVVCSGRAKAEGSLAEDTADADADAEEELALVFVDGKSGEELGTWVHGKAADEDVAAVVLVAVSPDRSVDIGGYRPGASGAAGAGGAPSIGLSLRMSQRELALSVEPTSSPTAAPEVLVTVAPALSPSASDSLSFFETPSPSASSTAATDQGTDGDSSSSFLGVEVADWVVPVVSGVIAAVLFLVVVACCCWCRGRRKKLRTKASVNELPASHEPQAFADPQRQSMAPAGIVLLSSTSSMDKGGDDRRDTPKDGGVGGDPKIDQIAVEESAEEPAAPSSGMTVPTATASATATSAASSFCGSPPEKLGSTLSGPASATSALNGEAGSEHQRRESFGAVSGRSADLRSLGDAKSPVVEEPEAIATDANGEEAELSPIGTQLVRDDSEPEALLPAHPSVEPPSVGSSPEKGAEEDAGEDATAGGEAKPRGGNERDSLGAGGGNASAAESVVDDDASDRDGLPPREGGVMIDAFAEPIPGQMPALLTPDHDCLLELEDGFDGSVEDEDTPVGTSATWDGIGVIPRDVSDDYGDVSEDRSSRRSSYLRRFSSDQNDSSLRSTSHDQDHSGRSFDEVSLSSMQMPELLSPPFPGMLPGPPSSLSTSGTDPGEHGSYGSRLGSTSGTGGVPPPAFYGKHPSGAGFYDVSLLRSSSSVGSQTQTDKSSPVSAPKGIYRPPRAPAWAESGAVAGGGSASKAKRFSDPPSYEALGAMSSDAADVTSLTQEV